MMAEAKGEYDPKMIDAFGRAQRNAKRRAATAKKKAAAEVPPAKPVEEPAPPPEKAPKKSNKPAVTRVAVAPTPAGFAAQKLSEARPSSSASMLVLAAGLFIFMVGMTGGEKLKLKKLNREIEESLIRAQTEDEGFSGGGTGGGKSSGGGSAGAYNKLSFDLDEVSSGESGWVMPLSSMRLTQAFRGPTTGSNYVTGSHRGADYAAALGTPAYAIASGKVVGVTKEGLIRVGPGTYQGQFNRAYGPNSVELLTDSGYSVVYGHFSSVAVKVGQRVQAGQLLGHTGSSTGYFGAGPHLHIEITKLIDGIVHWFDPEKLLKGKATTPSGSSGSGGGSSTGTVTPAPSTRPPGGGGTTKWIAE